MKAPDNRESVLARYTDGHELLTGIVRGLGDAELDHAPPQRGWTIRQIVHHVADGDDLWKVCIKEALGNQQAVFSLEWYWKIPQEVWARRWAYDRRPVDVSLALLEANRRHILQLLEAVPDAWHRSVALRRPNQEIERMPVGAVIEMQADHVAHHVKQIEAILAGRVGAGDNRPTWTG